MNSAVEPIFNKNFAEKRGLWALKQCTGPTDRHIFQSLGVIFGYCSRGAHKFWMPNAGVALKSCIQTSHNTKVKSTKYS